LPFSSFDGAYSAHIHTLLRGLNDNCELFAVEARKGDEVARKQVKVARERHNAGLGFRFDGPESDRGVARSRRDRAHVKAAAGAKRESRCRLRICVVSDEITRAAHDDGAADEALRKNGRAVARAQSHGRAVVARAWEIVGDEVVRLERRRAVCRGGRERRVEQLALLQDEPSVDTRKQIVGICRGRRHESETKKRSEKRSLQEGVHEYLAFVTAGKEWIEKRECAP
jgi:hypothetical protein